MTVAEWPRLDLYAPAQLQRLLRPRNIAVVGATERAGAFGQRAVNALKNFGGDVYPINGKYPHIGGYKAYERLADLPVSPDAVVMAVPAAQCQAVLEQCVEAGAGGVVVFAGGYAETAIREDVARQELLERTARAGGVPLVGPNCLGLQVASNGASMTFHTIQHDPRLMGRSIGIVSQSGGLGFALAQCASRGAGLSHVLTSGNGSDVDVADFIAYLVEDDDCSAIACTFEGMREPRRIVAAARRAGEAGKPLVIFKAGRSEAGAMAALSHTGTLAGAHASYVAALEDAGAICVDTFDELIDTTRFFAKAGPPRGTGIAVLATSGGGAIMVADAAEGHGIALPQPDARATKVLEANIPAYGSARNPCDVTPQVLTTPGSLEACVCALLACPQYSTLVNPNVSAIPATQDRMAVFQQLAAAAEKPICLVWQNEWLGGPGIVEAEQSSHVAFFRSLDVCMSAIQHWHRHGRWLESRSAPQTFVKVNAETRAAASRALASSSSEVMAEADSKRLLAMYGLPVATQTVAGSAQTACDAAINIGLPVALKVHSDAIAHKTDMGGVRLQLETPQQVAAAYAEIDANARAFLNTDQSTKVLVQKMVPRGIELLVGGRVDPQFGPMVVVGFGGVLVELLSDVAIALAPVSVERARELLLSLRGAKLLAGYRGMKAVDLDAMARIVAGASEFLADQREAVRELDINPVICTDNGNFVADTMVTRNTANQTFQFDVSRFH